MKDHGTRLLFEMFTDAPPPMDLRDEGNTGRLIYSVRGGSFEGERLRGTVLPTCGDWVTICPGGRLEFDARILLRTDDDALIYISFTGHKMITDEQVTLMEQGNLHRSSDTSYVINPVFETCSQKYAWLKDIRAVCHGHRTSEGLQSQFYELL